MAMEAVERHLVEYVERVYRRAEKLVIHARRLRRKAIAKALRAACHVCLARLKSGRGRQYCEQCAVRQRRVSQRLQYWFRGRHSSRMWRQRNRQRVREYNRAARRKATLG